VRSSITELILDINEMIPDIMIEGIAAARRRPRGLFNFIGWSMKYIYGTATDSDVELLWKELLAMKGIISASAADAARSREGLATYTKLTGERLDTMHSIVEGQQAQIGSVADSVREIMATVNFEINAVGAMAKELSLYVKCMIRCRCYARD